MIDAENPEKYKPQTPRPYRGGNPLVDKVTNSPHQPTEDPVDTPEQKHEFFMDEIVTAICLRNGDAYSKAEIIKKAADRYHKSQTEAVLREVVGGGKNDSPHNMNAHTERDILRIEQRQRAANLGYTLTTDKGDK